MTQSASPSATDSIDAFAAACDEVTDVLLRGSGMEQWIVTRTTREAQRVLASAGAAFVLNRRSSLAFDESICAQMIAGGPRCEMSVPDNPVYGSVPMALRHGIGAYVGAVIFDADGTVFGTLAGIDTRRHPTVTDGVDRQVQLHAALLTTQLATARAMDTPPIVTPDPVTGFADAASWLALRAWHERTCQALGDDAAVLTLQLHGLDDLRAGHGSLVADESVRELAYALRSSGITVAGRVDDGRFVAVNRNEPLNVARLRSTVAASAEAAGLVAELHVTYRRWADTDGLAQAEQRAWRASGRPVPSARKLALA